jgi:GntR family transcriptional regulator/MocR family aminotransferase
MKTPVPISAQDLAEALKQRGVLIEPGHVFFENPQDGSRYYRIAYSSIESAKIDAGITIIAETIDSFRNN